MSPNGSSDGHGRDPFFTIEMLPAGCGDALWIEYGRGDDVHRVLVDGGTHKTLDHLKARFAKVPGRKPHFDLIVVSHIDDDHIDGIVRLFIDKSIRFEVDDVWINAWDQLPDTRPDDRLGAGGAEFFALLLKRRRLPINAAFGGGPAVVPADAAAPLPAKQLAGGMRLTVLSPEPAHLTALRGEWQRQLERLHLWGVDWSEENLIAWMRADRRRKGESGDDILGPKRTKPVVTGADLCEAAEDAFSCDSSKQNGSSIALLAEFEGKSCLLAADAYAPVLSRNLARLRTERKKANEPLEVSAVKVPHHGSRANVSKQFVEAIECARFLVSTDGSGSQRHPDAEAIARIIAYSPHPLEIHFNYESARTKPWARKTLRDEFGYRAFYGLDGQLALEL